jgi:putative membrane protein
LGWFHTALQIRESVAIAILPRTLLFVLLSVVVVTTYELGYWSKPEIMGNLVGNVACNLVLGLLLVFRTNTAYDRYWEGRRAWGTFTISIRNLAREIKVGIAIAKPKKMSCSCSLPLPSLPNSTYAMKTIPANWSLCLARRRSTS